LSQRIIGRIVGRFQGVDEVPSLVFGVVDRVYPADVPEKLHVLVEPLLAHFLRHDLVVLRHQILVSDRTLEGRPEMLPKLTDDGEDVVSWPSEALKYLGKGYKPKDRSRPYVRVVRP